MSTIGSLLALMDPGIKPWSEGMQNVYQAQQTQTRNQTALLQLQEAKRQQEVEAQARQWMQAHPDSVLGSLGGAPGAPPGGMPLTQQPFAPGTGGAPQVVPGGQDLSRFADVSPQGGGPTEGQSVLGGLGAAGPGPAPQGNPLAALMRQNPDAALAVMTQQQKILSTQLSMRQKTAEAVAQQLQGATSQESYQGIVRDIATWAPQYAARMQPVYEKEAVQALIDEAISAKDLAQHRLDQMKVQALIRGQDVELAKAQQTGGKVNYEKDAQGHLVAVPEYTTGGSPVQSRLVIGADGQPIKSLEGQKLTAEQQRHLQTVEGGLRTHVDSLLQPLYQARDAIGRIEQSASSPTAAGDIALITAFMQMIDPRTGVKDQEYRTAAAAGSILDRVQAYLGNLKEGTVLDDDVRADFLQRSRMLYQQYDKDYGQVKQQYRDLTARMGGNPANVVLETGSTVAKAPLKPVGEMTVEELRAERDRLRGGR